MFENVLRTDGTTCLMTQIELSEMEKRVLNFFREHYPRDYTIQEVADELDIHRNTASTHIHFLKRIDKLILTRTLGKMNFYTINIKTVKPKEEKKGN